MSDAIFNPNNIKFGRVKDTIDTRDFDARRLVVRDLPLPSKYDVNPNTIIYDQDGKPMCVGYAAAGVKTDQEFTQWKNEIKFDGEWLYNECKKLDGSPNADGTQLRFALQVMTQWMKEMDSLGICKYFNSSKKPDAKWRIQGYFRIGNTESIDFVKQVMYQYGSLYVGSWWYDNWMNPPNNTIPVPTTHGNSGHAYRITGWDDGKNALILTNSWSKSWANGGRAYFPYEVFLTVLADTNTDCWKVVDAV